MGVSSLEEMIDDNHAIISSSIGPEYYVNIMSFVDKDQLEPGSSLLTHNKARQQTLSACRRARVAKSVSRACVCPSSP